ncbi:MAG TPA: hypothetical protein P5060_02590 [Candidatus Absconditabacterales bacterium]|nr:hypothetical protein [Candidatus Absconditabacterales bacterium]
MSKSNGIGKMHGDPHRDMLSEKLRKLKNKKRIPLIQKSSKELANNLLDSHNIVSDGESISSHDLMKMIKYINLLETSETNSYAKNKLSGKLTKKLDKKVAFFLIENNIRGISPRGRNTQVVVDNIDKFAKSGYQEIANKFIEEGYLGIVISNLEKFEGLNHQEFVDNLLEKEIDDYSSSSDIAYMIKYLEKFEGLNYDEIIDKLEEKGLYQNKRALISKLKSLNKPK